MALAEREGIDVDELVTEVAIEEAEPDEATDGNDAAGTDENGDAVPEAESDDEVAGVVDEALDREDVAVVWTQQGIRDPEAGARVEDAGKEYVEDRCLKVEYQRLM